MAGIPPFHHHRSEPSGRSTSLIDTPLGFVGFCLVLAMIVVFIGILFCAWMTAVSLYRGQWFEGFVQYPLGFCFSVAQFEVFRFVFAKRRQSR